MIILDTNVLSALIVDRQPPEVRRWIDRQQTTDIWTAAICVFEISYGLARMPSGRRSATMKACLSALLEDGLGGRVAAFDQAAAEAAGLLAASREARGRIVDMRDTFIAGVAISRGATLATRNIRDFDDLPIPMVNPWDP